MSSRLGSLAKTYPLQASAPDLPAPVRDSTGKWFEPFAWFDQDTQCWRTWQLSLVEGWEPFSETWPRSGMMRSGIAYRRAPLVLLTDETGSGLLPTPEASNTKAIALRSAGRSPRNFLKPLWPTPRANDPQKRGNFDLHNSRNGLPAAVKKWPTPRAQDGRKETRTPEGAAREVSRNKGPDLGAVAGGQLNPDWVEWLMGFPIGWTALKSWATPSSRKSRKSSATPSSKA